METVIPQRKFTLGQRQYFTAKQKGESQRKEELFMLNKIEKKKKFRRTVGGLESDERLRGQSPTEVFCSRWGKKNLVR